jgi:hypothetical protein
MSTRILYCTSEELIWECIDKVYCECSPENTTFYEREATVVKRELRRIEDRSGIVELYTRLSLTQPTDRLVAMSGVAKVFDQLGLGKYYAGLWEQLLGFQLAWFRSNSSLNS